MTSVPLNNMRQQIATVQFNSVKVKTMQQSNTEVNINKPNKKV